MKRKRLTTLTKDEPVRSYAVDQMEIKYTEPAIRKFESYLGRAAVLADLVDRTLQSYFKSLGTLAAATQYTHQSVLLHIARHAAERGIIEWPAPEWSTRANAYEPHGDGGKLGLLRYFEEIYLAGRTTSLTPETLKTYRKHLRAYERFAWKGARSLIDSIDSRSLNKFREWLTTSGVSAKQVREYAFTVAAVAKHANPERFMGPVLPADAGVDSKRALIHVFETMYLPAKPVITSPRTEHLYRMTFNVFGRYLGYVATLDDLTDEKIGGLMRSLKASGKAPATVNGYRDKLRAIWEWSARRKLVEVFPTIAAMPEPARIPSAWSREQLLALFLACGKMPGVISGVAASDWWRAIHLVSWDSGARTGELFQLRWDMFDPRTRKLVVPAQIRKGGLKPMVYTLKRDTAALLRRIASPERELILPWDRNRDRFYADYKRLLRIAGLPYVRWKSCLQKMRRSFATHLEAAGGNATLALAHSARSLTEKSYLDPVLIEHAPANELLFPLETSLAGV